MSVTIYHSTRHTSILCNSNSSAYKWKVNIKWTRYRSGVAQRVGRCIALLFHDRGTRRGWVVSSTPRTHFTPGKDPVLILQEAGWAPGPVWTGGKSRPHRNSIPDRSARSSVAIPTELPGPLCLQTRLKMCSLNKMIEGNAHQWRKKWSLSVRTFHVWN